jgi:hypothetical protein
MGGPERTVLCEWTNDGTHANYGTGPEATLEALANALDELLNQRAP